MQHGSTCLPVPDALEKDPVQAANLKLRSSLMREISKFVESQELTQAEAAKKLGTTQPRLNDVLKLERLNKVDALESEAGKIQRRLNKEKQFNRKVELNSTLREVQAEIHQLS